jgi:hypothetical protein
MSLDYIVLDEVIEISIDEFIVQILVFDQLVVKIFGNLVPIVPLILIGVISIVIVSVERRVRSCVDGHARTERHTNGVAQNHLLVLMF